MSDKPKLKYREVTNPSPQQLREALEEYVQHTLSHDPDTLEFALMVTGHGRANGSTHVCSMISGPPQTIAYALTKLMSELINRDPEFATFFLLSFLQHMNVEIDFDVTSGSDVETQVKNLISKLQGGTPPSRSVH